MIFKGHENLLELGARIFKTRSPLEIGDGLGVANTGDDVFALGIDKEVAIELFGSVCRVAGKGDTGSRSLALVTKNHHLHVDGSAQII